MKRILSLLLALFLTAGLFGSCSESRENTDAETTPGQTSADAEPGAEPEAETEPDRAHVPDNLPELDFNGETVVVHSRGDTESVEEVKVEELTGEATSDAIYERNAMVEERLNCKIDVFAGDGWENYNSTVSSLRASIMSSALVSLPSMAAAKSEESRASSEIFSESCGLGIFLAVFFKVSGEMR